MRNMLCYNALWRCAEVSWMTAVPYVGCGRAMSLIGAAVGGEPSVFGGREAELLREQAVECLAHGYAAVGGYGLHGVGCVLLQLLGGVVEAHVIDVPVERLA